MRRRLLIATVGTVAIGVILLGMPLAVAVRGLLNDQAMDTLQRQAEQAQVLFNQQSLTQRQRREVLNEFADEFDVRFQVLDRVVIDGRLVQFQATEDTGAMDGEVIRFDDDVAVAVLEGEAGRVRRDGLLAVSVPLRFGSVPQVLRAVTSDDALQLELSRALILIAALAAVSLGMAGLIGLMVARRLAIPLEDLSQAARLLGQGDFSTRAPRSGIPESDQVAAALNITADRIGTMVERSRSFGADASHQLRTPLTALRLDLEALELTADGLDPAQLGLLEACFAEADRLEATIEELLTLADLPMGDEELRLGGLVEERLASWQVLAESEGRLVVSHIEPTPTVRARAAAIGQCLQVLLDNALEHGEGTITVSVSSVAGPSSSRTWVRLCVRDEGAGFPADAQPGRGLRLAKSLVQAEGGRIQVERSATVCLLLPATPVDSVQVEPRAAWRV